MCPQIPGKSGFSDMKQAIPGTSVVVTSHPSLQGVVMEQTAVASVAENFVRTMDANIGRKAKHG